MDSPTTTATTTQHVADTQVTLHFFITDPLTKKTVKRSALALCTGNRATWGDTTHWLYVHTKNGYENWIDAETLRAMYPVPDGKDSIVDFAG
jgi:hypothetical protein